MVLLASESQTTMSASAPTEMLPFLGYMLNICAALVDVTATNYIARYVYARRAGGGAGGIKAEVATIGFDQRLRSR